MASAASHLAVERQGLEPAALTRRRFLVRSSTIVGAAALVTTGLVTLATPALAATCHELTQFCVDCCDEKCPHAECYNDCTTCFYRCRDQGQEDCDHSYGCWFGDLPD